MNLGHEGRLFRNPMVPYKEYKRIIYEPGKVARITLNRPQYVNAMSHALWGELEDAIDKAIDDTECRVIVIGANGRHFSSGDDVIGLSPEGAPSLVTGETPEEVLKRFPSEKALWHQYNIEHDYYPLGFCNRMMQNPKPTIAMVHGYTVYAGFMVASCLDLVFASADTLFLWGGAGASFFGHWDLGSRKVLELLYEHRFFTAQEALDYHFVSRVYPDVETLERETLAYANRVANQPLSALQRIKDEWVKVMAIRGVFDAYEATKSASWQMWRYWAEDGHPERNQGKGIARTPVALNNLKIKLESEGKTVPENVLGAIARAAARDDKAAWKKALSQSWRQSGRGKGQAQAEPAAAGDGPIEKKD